MKIFATKRNMSVSSTDLFQAFADPLILSKWWGPEGFTTTSESFEFKPNGIWKFVMRGPDGKNYPNEMIFREIVSTNKIVMRHSVEPLFTLTVTFEDTPNGALVRWHQDFDSEEVARKIAHIVEPGNEQNLDKLQVILASTSASG